MATVNQPSRAPTRKLSAAVLISAVFGVVEVVVRNHWPEYADAAMWNGLETATIMLVGYFLVKDKPNVISEETPMNIGS